METFWSTQLVHVAANRADASWNHHSFLDCKSAFLDITTHSIGIYTTILYTFSIIKTQFPFHGNGAMQSLCWAQGQYLEMVRPKTTFEAMARSEGMSSGSIALRHTQTPWLIWLGDFESTVSEQPGEAFGVERQSWKCNHQAARRWSWWHNHFRHRQKYQKFVISFIGFGLVKITDVSNNRRLSPFEIVCALSDSTDVINMSCMPQRGSHKESDRQHKVCALKAGFAGFCAWFCLVKRR